MDHSTSEASNEGRGMVKPACKGTIEMFRYADDGVICWQLEADAIRIRHSLGKRLEKFKLQLNEEKTKLVPFDKKVATLLEW